METNIKHAVVTGGTRGIGKKIVETLIQNNYFVDFTYINSQSAANELTQKYEGKCRATKVDGSNPQEVKEYMELVKDKGNTTVLINNAGITINSLLKDSSVEDIEKIMKTNLGGVIHFCTEAIPQMLKEKKGDIINISSLASQNIRAGNGLYGMSKSAIERYSEGLALEMARFNIATNIISPGYVETDIIKNLICNPEEKKKILKSIPLRKFTQEQDIADAIVFLLSRKPMLIGANLPIGGGGQLA